MGTTPWYYFAIPLLALLLIFGFVGLIAFIFGVIILAVGIFLAIFLPIHFKNKKKKQQEKENNRKQIG